VRGDPAAPHGAQGQAEEIGEEVEAGEEEEEPHPEVTDVRDEPCRALVPVAAQRVREDRRAKKYREEGEDRERRPCPKRQRRPCLEEDIDVHRTVDQEER